MSILCALGRHAPDAYPRWNDGYYFARCRRCGHDLVRTAFEGWHIPEGFRVVWAASPPEERAEIGLQPNEEGQTPAPEAEAEARVGAAFAGGVTAGLVAPAGDEAGGVSPMEEEPPVPSPSEEPDMEQASGDAAEDGATASAEGEAAFPEAASVSNVVRGEEAAPAPVAGGGRRLPIDALFSRLRRSGEMPPAASTDRDFMSDDPSDELVILPTGMNEPPGGSHPGAGRPDSGEEATQPSAVSRFVAAARDTLSPPNGELPNPWTVLGIALSLSGLVALGVMIGMSRGEPVPGSEAPPAQFASAGAEGGQAPAPAPMSAHAEGGAAAAGSAAPRVVRRAVTGTPQRPTLFVAARTLSCRDAPALQGRRVRRLSRGEKVTLLAADGDWVSVDYRHCQCWTQARFLSPVHPA